MFVVFTVHSHNDFASVHLYYHEQWAATRGFFPYMLVTVGSGVSVLKVNSPDDFERVSGTALGGGSFWGLCKLLVDIGEFDKLIDTLGSGDSTKTDLLVGDIYGGDYDAIGLNATTTASLFVAYSYFCLHLLCSCFMFFYSVFDKLWEASENNGRRLQRQ